MMAVCNMCNKRKFKSNVHNVLTEKVNKIALNNNDDTKLETSDGTVSYSCVTKTRKVCKAELLRYLKNKIWND